MQDELGIDVKKYLRLLLRNWRWIAGAGITGGILMLIVAFMVPKTYEASALFAVTGPRYQIGFAPDFITSNTVRPPVKAFADLAVSDEIVSDVLSKGQENEAVDPELTFRKLKKSMKAKPGSDPSVLILTVSSKDPESALILSSTWTDIFLHDIQEAFGRATPEEIAFIEQQVTEAGWNRQNAADALVAYQTDNPEAILAVNLETNRMAYYDLRTRMRIIENLLERIVLEKAMLADQDEHAYARVNDRFVVLLIRLDAAAYMASRPGATGKLSDEDIARGAQMEYPSSLPGMQWQLDLGSLETVSVADLRNELHSIDIALRVQSERLAVESESRAAAVLEWQAALQHAVNGRQKLEQEMESAANIFLTMERKLAETRILTESDNEVRLVSNAVQAMESSDSELVYPLIGGAASATIMILVLLFLDWWKPPATYEDPKKELHQRASIAK